MVLSYFSHLFSQNAALQQASHALLRHLLQAQRSSAPLKYLLHADVALAELRMHWRLAHGWNLISDGSFEHGFRLMEEVGRLLGAWIKNTRAAALRAASQANASSS